MKTTTRRKFSAIILILSMSLISCSEKTPVDIEPPGQSTGPIPLEIGVRWIYEVHDSLTESTETIEVTIVDTLTMGNGTSVSVWEYTRGGITTTRYVGVIGDTLAFYDDSLDVRPSEYFVYPLTLGAGWIGPDAYPDTSWVTDSGLVSVPAGDFDNGVRIKRRWDFDFEGGGKHCCTWIASEVGILYRHLHSQYSDGTTTYTTKNEVWKLLNFGVPVTPARNGGPTVEG